MSILQYIKENDLEDLISKYRNDRQRFIQNEYDNYKKCYIDYFAQRKDYKRLVWNLGVKSIVKKPFSDAFYGELRPAAYAEQGKTPSFENAIIDLKDNISLYESLTFFDEKSYRVLDTILQYRLTSNKTFLFKEIDQANLMYFDSFIRLSESEVFVDCGAYIGDTIKSFLKKTCSYKKIVAFEPDNQNYKKLEKYCSRISNVYIYNYILGAREDIARLDGGSVGCHVVHEGTGKQKRVVSLDNVIDDKVTFIKLDVEGSEYDVLLGAKNHIVADLPILAVSVYHKLSDIYKIPCLIEKLSSRYKFILRHYGCSSSELVLYAIPDYRL